MTGGESEQQPASAAGADAAAALLTLATSGWRQAVLAIALRLDLAAMLGARAADLEEVCYSLGTGRQPTQLFLAACEGLALVAERDGEYRLGPLGQALRASATAALADWTAAAADARVRDAVWDALHQPRLGEAPATTGDTGPGAAAVAALGLPHPAAPPLDAARARAALQALHGPAAAALAAALPPPRGGLLLESGGQGVYAAACLERDARLQAVLVDLAPWATGDIAGGPAGGTGRVRALAALAALGDERAALAVLAQATRTLPLGTMRTRLGELARYLAPGATLAVVGPFRAGAGRPLAPLLALLELAAGGPGWCPTVAQVADAIGAAGLAVTRTLLLPEPAAALLAQPA
ncbi:MAG TPA: hypothetical protein VFE37_05645 [Chloroflexota bacterium]|nr:hypothetical protein [Chloroflexota bacterium]